MSESLVVTHFGPYGDTAGGIATVIRTYEQLPWNRIETRVAITYTPTARLWSLGLLLRALIRLLRSRGIVQAHLSYGGSFVREGAIVVAASMLRRPTVISLHGSDFRHFALQHPRLTRFVLERADSVWTLGSRMANDVRVSAPRAPIKETMNPVALQQMRDSVPTTPLIVFGGEVGHRKGVDLLLGAWATVHRAAPDARLVIAGPLAPGFTLGQLGAGIEMAGQLSHADFVRLVDKATLLVLPSRREAMPMVVLEAMARGIPIVASDVGALREMVGDGGIIVAEGDSPALAAALLDLATTPEKVKLLGANAYRRCAQRFDLPVVASDLEREYERLALGRRDG